VLGLITTPLILRGLGASAYGVFAMSSLISAHLSNLELGFGQATVRYVARALAAEDRPGEQSVVNTSLAIFMAAGTLAGGLFFASAGFLATRVFEIPSELRGDAVVAFRLGATILGCSFLSSFFTGALQAHGQFGLLNAIRTVFGTLAAGGAVAAVASGGGLVAVFALQAVIALMAVVALAACLTYVRGELAVPRLDSRRAREMFAFGALVFIAGIAYQWMINGPGLILAAQVAAGQIPAFSIPHTVLQKLSLLIGAAGAVFYPFVSGQSARTDRAALPPVFQGHLRLTLLGLGPMSAFLAVYAERLLGAWITPEFGLAGGPCLRVLSGAALVMALASPATDVARGLGRPDVVL
jgi:O-antigen/teichoic acid export membrane protein